MIYEIHYSHSEMELPVRLKLLGIGHLQEPVNRPNGIALSQWFYCTKGKGEFFIGGQRSVVSKGQGLLILPSIGHRYRAVTDDWTMDFAAFDGKLHTELLQALGMRESGVYQISDPQLFPKYIRELDEIRKSDRKGKQMAYSEKCYAFLLGMGSACFHMTDSQLLEGNELIRTLIVFMEKNYSRPITLNDLSELTGYTGEYLCSVFKKAMRQTIMQYLNRLRISRARILLAQFPEKKIFEIAGMCGFESPSYFGAVFKKEAGVTPEQFRRGIS